MPCFYLTTILGPHCLQITPSSDPQLVTESPWPTPPVLLTSPGPKQEAPPHPSRWALCSLCWDGTSSLSKSNSASFSSRGIFPFPSSCKRQGLLPGQLKSTPDFHLCSATYCDNKLPKLSDLTFLLSKMGVMSSHCGAMGLEVSWELWDAGLIPGTVG